MDEALPEGVADELARLGEPTDEFRAGSAQLLLATVGGALALLLACAAVIGVIALLAARRVKGGTGMAAVKLACVALFFVATGAGMLRRARSNRGLRVLVFPEALARVQGEGVEVLRWEDVNAVRRLVKVKSEGVTVLTLGQLLLLGRGGQTLAFTEDLADLPELRRLIEQHTLKHMLPPALEAVEAGSAVGFGALVASREGLQHEAEVLPWASYEDAEVARGWVTVRALVEQHTLKHMLPPALEALAAGEAIGFGVLSASKDGLHHGLDTLPWHEIESIEAGEGLVVVKCGEGRHGLDVEVSDVPNAHVLVALAEQARGSAM